MSPAASRPDPPISTLRIPTLEPRPAPPQLLPSLARLASKSIPTPQSHHLHRSAMDPFHHLNTSFSNPYHPLLSPSPPHHPHHYPPLPPPPLPPPADPSPPQLQPSASLDRERLPQWSHAETATFLAVRAELDHSFLTTKRNKALWEAVSARLQGQGFARTPDQCKSKWKNLVTRFKGTEAAAAAAHQSQDADPASASSAAAQQAARQFPFHDEMRRIFDARVERAQALERKRAKGKDVRTEDDEGGGEGEDDDDEEEELAEAAEVGEDEAAGSRVVAAADARGGGGDKKRRRKHAVAPARSSADQGEVEAMLREFMRRQVEMEERWMEAAEAREAERRAREEEWRNAMVALGEERLALVRRWREREDAWRARAEEREERRHQLVAALLAKLGGDSS